MTTIPRRANGGWPAEFRGRIPGEPGIWVFIVGDMVVFALFFFVYLSERAQQVALFDEAQKTLGLTFGLVNTLLLVTSSLCVAKGIRAAREGRLRLSKRLLELGILCGLGFAGIKTAEWSGKVAAGQGPMANDFYMLFFIFTGIHFLHLLIGLVVLFFMRRIVTLETIGEQNIVALENGASFWHLVDLLWVVLFALFYLVHS